MFSELINRQSRARNIILFNVFEFSTMLPADKCKDTSSFLKPLDLKLHSFSVCGLGNISNKSRPFVSNVFQILKVKYKLRNVNNYMAVRISSDQTLLQRNNYKTIVSRKKKKKKRTLVNLTYSLNI